MVWGASSSEPSNPHLRHLAKSAVATNPLQMWNNKKVGHPTNTITLDFSCPEILPLASDRTG